MKKHLPAKQFQEIKKTFKASKQKDFITAVNARAVHDWLGVKTKYAMWIQRRIEKYKFEENVDYCLTKSKIGIRSNVEQIDYHCTPDMIKQLAMIESSAMGRLARLYFIDCETKAAELQDQSRKRDDLKVEFKPITKAIKDSRENPQPYHYSNESDMINKIVLGKSAAKFRVENDIGKSESVRDYMTSLQMDAVIDLQRANTVFIQCGNDYKSRKESLLDMFDRRFKDKMIEEAKMIGA